jgi:hypothetical protein
MNDYAGTPSTRRSAGAMVLARHRFANDWLDAVNVDPGGYGKAVFHAPKEIPTAPGVLVLTKRPPPSVAADAPRLALGYTVVRTDLPAITQVANPQGVEYRPDGVLFVWVGTKPVRVSATTGNQSGMVLSARAEPGPALPAGSAMRLEVRVNGGPPAEITLPAAPGPFRLPGELGPGQNQIEVRSLVPVRPGWPTDGSLRELLVCVSDFQLTAP